VSARLGIAVSTDGVRAVAVQDEIILWGAESSLEGRSIGEAIGELLTAGRLRRWPRPVMVAAVGPARSQLRKLTGLPPVADAGALTRLVGESAGRFFLRNGVPLATTGVRRDRESDGEGWGAAIEQPVIAALEAACRTHGLRLAAVLPTLAVIPRALQGDSLVWRDGEVCAHLTILDGRLHALRRGIIGDAPSSTSDEPPHAVPALAALGTDGWRFADAYGAAIASVRDPLAYRLARFANAEPVRTLRIAAALLACLIALTLTAVAPTIAIRHAGARAEVGLSTLARERRGAEASEAELTRVSAALGEVALFDQNRRSVTILLSDLARALPSGSAMVSLRVDSAGGTLVALAPRAAALIERLEDVPDLATPSFIGPVTREVAASAEVERVAIHFLWAGAPPSPTIPAKAR
jgi:hypothetical protein